MIQSLIKYLEKEDYIFLGRIKIQFFVPGFSLGMDPDPSFSR